MKTLPEILTKFEIIDTSHLYHHEHDADKLKQAIAKELMGCLPEKKGLDVEQGVSRYAPNGKDMWGNHYADIVNGKIEGHNQALDEVTARLTAFIGLKEQ